MPVMFSEMPVRLCGIILSCPALDQHHIPAAFNVQALRHDGRAVILDLEREDFDDDPQIPGGSLSLGSRSFRLVLREGQEPTIRIRHGG